MAEAISESVLPGSVDYEVTTELVREVIKALDNGTKSMRGPDKARFSIGAANTALIWLFTKTIKPEIRLEAFEDMVAHMRKTLTEGLKEKTDG